MRRRHFLASAGAAIALGPSLAAARDAERLIVAGGDLTEIVFALGAGDQIVGVDTTSTYPAAAKSRAQIGYVRRISAEGALSLAPTVLLAAHDAGPPVALDQLRAAGVEVSLAPKGETPDDVPDKIEHIGRLLGLEAKATAMAQDYRARLAAARAEVAGLAEAAAPSGRPRVLFVLTVRGGAPLVGGAASSADVMIRAAGGENVAAGFEGYKPMSQEAILAAAPDVLLMMEEHAARAGGVDVVLARPDLAPTPAGRARRAAVMPGMLLLGFGPRTPEAVTELARRLRADPVKTQ